MSFRARRLTDSPLIEPFQWGRFSGPRTQVSSFDLLCSETPDSSGAAPPVVDLPQQQTRLAGLER